jgi:hypothetical protein
MILFPFYTGWWKKISSLFHLLSWNILGCSIGLFRINFNPTALLSFLVLSIQYTSLLREQNTLMCSPKTLTFIHYSGSTGAQSPEKMELVGSSETGTLLHNYKLSKHSLCCILVTQMSINVLLMRTGSSMFVQYRTVLLWAIVSSELHKLRTSEHSTTSDGNIWHHFLEWDSE